MARPFCGARSRSGGECHRPAGWGTGSDVGRCKLHGGSTPTHRKFAQTETLRREVERLGIPVQADPGESLMMALWSALGQMLYLQSRAGELDEPTIIQQGPGGARTLTPHPVAEMLARAEQRVADISAAALRAGVEDRRIRLEQRQAELLFAAIRSALAAVGLGDREEEFRRAFMTALAASDQKELPRV